MGKYSIKTESFYIFIVTLLFPFVGLILSLVQWKKSWAMNMFWLACIYMGAILIYHHEGTMLGEGMDSGRYVLILINMYNNPSLTFWSILSLYQIDMNHMDLYQQLITYFVSRFTDNGHVLFAVFATVFGFFYSRNIWYILDKLPSKKLGILYVLFGLFFLVCPITQINGVRMWTALHVLVYAMLPYLVEKKKSRLWLLFITPLIHFSYLYVGIFSIIYVLIPFRFKTNNSLFIYFAIITYIVTLFINSLSLDTVSSMIAEYSPEAYEDRIDLYVNQNLLDRNNATAATNNWYLAVGKNISNWCYSIILVLLFPVIRKYFKGNKTITNLYVYTMLIGSFANITALIPSGGRFQILATMFKLSTILLIILNIPKNMTVYKISSIFSIILILPLIVEFRKLFDFFGINLIFGNFITAFISETNVPLIVFIKSLL